MKSTGYFFSSFSDLGRCFNVQKADKQYMKVDDHTEHGDKNLPVSALDLVSLSSNEYTLINLSDFILVSFC